MILKTQIDKTLENKSVKDILKNTLNLSNRLIIKLKKYKQIYCNDKLCYTNHIVKLNDVISVNIDFKEEGNIVPRSFPLDILYEDECLLIVNKSAGIPTHPSMEHFTDTLSNFVKDYYIKHNINSLIRPVNRLDKDTSGIVIFAKNQYIQECLIKQMKNNEFKKYYYAVIEGTLANQNGTICLPIARQADSIIKRCVNENGQVAITNYKVENEIKQKNCSLISIYLQTGRTHQIRVHFSHIGHSLLGDTLYGGNTQYISRQALHCKEVYFKHPLTDNLIHITCSLPKDIEQILN